MAIEIRMKALLSHRALAVRAVAEAAHLAARGSGQSMSVAPAYDLTDPFVAETVSAFAEIYNNIVLHSYGRGHEGEITIRLVPHDGELLIEIGDHGKPFEIATVPAPDPESLPEGGLGLHIARSLLDELTYVPSPAAGAPNFWRLRKRAPIRRLQPSTFPAA